MPCWRCCFCSGVQSTFFGPLKYSILPQQLSERELIGGNAQIEMGTFVSILLGTIIGGVVASQADVNSWLTLMVVVVALVGYLASRYIPTCEPTAPDLKVDLNPITATWPMIGQARRNRTVFLAILGISWFWLLGSVMLTQIPNLTKVYLGGATSVVTLILSVFTISVAVGSLTCEEVITSAHRDWHRPVRCFWSELGGI